MEAVQLGFWVVAALVVLAILFDFMNGFHDAANSIATVVSTGVLKPQQAVVFATFFNFIAIFVFHLSVAKTIGKGIVEPGVVDVHVVFGALVGAIVWNVVTWIYGLPSSSSHALIGGLVGATLTKVGPGGLVAAGVLKTVAFIFISPLFGFLFGSLLMVAVAHLFQGKSPLKIDRVFRRGQLVSAGLYSLGHGGNDAQKTIGIIWMLLIATGYVAATDAAPPWWVIWSCYTAIAAGTMFGGWRIVKTMGQKITKLRRRDHAVPGHRAGHSGQHHPHHHRRDRRRRIHAPHERGALGRGGQYRLGLDLHDPGLGVDCRRVLWHQQVAVLRRRHRIFM
jgi:inorganic phosphate transporter, PiT family